MADQLDLFRKQFARLRKEIDDGTHDILAAGTSSRKLQELGKGGLDDFLDRGLALKKTGFAGTKLTDYPTDKDIKKSHDVCMEAIKTFGQHQQKGMMAYVKAKQMLGQLDQLQKGIADEIKDRKKKVSTKLGLGNKSVPEMEKLLKEVTAYLKEDDNRDTIRGFDTDKDDFGDRLKAALNGAVDDINKLKAPSTPADGEKRVLDIRILGGVVNRSKIAYDAMMAAGDDVQSRKKNADAIIALTEEYKKYWDTAKGKSTVGEAKDPKIGKFVLALQKMRAAAEK